MTGGGNCEKELHLRVYAQDLGPTSLVPDKEAGVGDAIKGRITWHMGLRIIVVEPDGIKDVPVEALRHQGAVPVHANDMWESIAGTC